MGLDMYATAFPAGTTEPGKCEFYKEIKYWRKHHDLHGWMARKWLESNPDKTEADFNLVFLKLDKDTLMQLRHDVLHDKLPNTTGFFFGNYPPDEESKKEDIQFIEDALAELDKGHVVYYHSWW
jgi:hypothetical protein